MKFFKLSSLSLCMAVMMLSSCQLFNSEENVELEIFLPYLSENKADTSRAVSSPDSGESFDFTADFKFVDGSDTFTLKGKSGSTISTGRIRAGTWAITLNAYQNNVLVYSAATKTKLNPNQHKELAFSFAKAGGDGQGSSVRTGSANVDFSAVSYVKDTVNSLVIDLSSVNQEYLIDSILRLNDSNGNALITYSLPEDFYISANKTVTLTATLMKGTYNISIYQNAKRVAVSADIIVYGASIIYKISIPDVAATYAGKSIPVVIYGTNFQSPKFNSSSITVSGDISSISNFEIVSDEIIKGTILCPETSDTEITYKSISITINGETITESLKIIPVSKCIYKAGDFILSDGSLLGYKADLSSDEKDSIIGIVGATMYDGATVLVTALNFSSSLKFSTTNPSYSINPILSSADANKNVTGDIIGSDNLDYIVNSDDKAVKNLASSYPALAYANTYGTTNNLSGIFQKDWYLPSLNELYAIMTNYVKVNSARTVLGLEEINYYSTSTQYRTTAGNNNYYAVIYNYYLLYTSNFATQTKVRTVFRNSSSSFGVKNFNATCDTAYLNSTDTALELTEGAYQGHYQTISTNSSFTDVYTHYHNFYTYAMPVHIISIN